MSGNFEAALAMIMALEGGFSNHPSDPGGATKFGITHRALSDWYGHKVSVETVRDLTKAVAGEIYRAKYWNAARCEDLPSGVDLAVFDCAVNQGIARATRFLQMACGAKIDGFIGPETLDKSNAKPTEDLLAEFFALRMRAYGNLTSLFKTFGLGWSRRLISVHQESINLLHNPNHNHPRTTREPQKNPNPSPNHNQHPSPKPNHNHNPYPNHQPTTNQNQEQNPMPLTLIDILLGGQFLTGRKTIIGIIGYVALFIANSNGMLPEFVTPTLYEQALTMMAGLAGLGAVSKVTKIMRFFGIADAPKKVVDAGQTRNPNQVDPFAVR